MTVIGDVIVNTTAGQYTLAGGELTGADTAPVTQAPVAVADETTVQLFYDAVSTEALTFVGPGGGTLSNVTTIDPTGTSDDRFTQDGGALVVGVDGGLDPNNPATDRATTNIAGEYTTLLGAALAVDIFGNADGDFRQSPNLGQEQIVAELPPLTLDNVLNDPTASDLLIVGDPDGTNLMLADLTDGFTLDVDLNGLQAPFLGYYDVLLADEILIDPDTFTLNGIGLWRITTLDDGSQVLQVAAPEPAALALWTLLALAAFAYTRRKR